MRTISLLGPFRGRKITDEQDAFNGGIRNGRLRVEWAFAYLTNNWSHVRIPHNMRAGLSIVGVYYPLCVLFSNIQICVGRGSSI
ncbi:hypothetical protein BC939DRAFT_400279 [Gamsiella multidivaricata]|uniref:uncharacterized protein n=1 Tax=Gamsiella multidivaricata TaxID=101098 RepID=UPI0022201AB5|nr:uncharacterized protein BC939DRAFT_400279 [Gamsiella multidivaricata]KAI7819626.1 hypothetical protein BC939DRAFT_400279 [Gamsiella multidivaricata]